MRKLFYLSPSSPSSPLSPLSARQIGRLCLNQTVLEPHLAQHLFFIIIIYFLT